MICHHQPLFWTHQIHLNGSRQDKDRGVIPENQLQKVDPNAMAYSFAVKLGCRAAANADLLIC